MLTFLSRSIRELVDSARKREAPSQIGALPDGADFAAELARLRGAWHRAQLRVAESSGGSDIPIAPPAPAVSTAFVAGQGARIYSLDVFRSRGPRPPKAA